MLYHLKFTIKCYPAKIYNLILCVLPKIQAYLHQDHKIECVNSWTSAVCHFILLGSLYSAMSTTKRIYVHLFPTLVMHHLNIYITQVDLLQHYYLLNE